MRRLSEYLEATVKERRRVDAVLDLGGRRGELQRLLITAKGDVKSRGSSASEKAAAPGPRFPHA